jgi:hypothetical protein
LGRKVAIKVLSPDLASDEAFRRRFLRESQAAAALEHPNIVPVYDAGESEGCAYISMRFVDGTDLAALLKAEGRLSPTACIGALAQIASALDAAHARGLIHRDVKPANILLERLGEEVPRAFLSDFGITKRLDGHQTTETGRFIGTIDYTAPEQITGAQVGPATDQYSLACVMFQCLTGSVPFPRGTELAVMYAHLEEKPPRASEHLVLPESIDPVIQRAMSKGPDQRFGSCREMQSAAADALGIDIPPSASGVPGSSGTTFVAPPDRLTVSPGRRRGAGSRHVRRGLRVPVVAAVGVLAIGGIAWAIVASQADRAPGHAAPGGTTATFASTAASSPAPTASPSTRVTKPFPEEFRWTRVTSPVFGGLGRMAINRAVAGRSSIVAVGFVNPPGADGGDPVAWRSSDGRIWDRTYQSEPGTQGMDAVAMYGRNYIAVGTEDQQHARVWIIPADGSSWHSVDATGISGGSAIHKLIVTPQGLVAVGWATEATDKDASVWSSSDGRHWTRDTGDAFVGPAGSDQEMWAVTQFPGGLVAVGSDNRGGDQDAAFWLHDQQGWRQAAVPPSPGDQVVKAVVAGGPGLVAVGSTETSGGKDAAIWTSTDGVRWREIPGLARPGTQQLTGVVAYRGGFVAVGSDGSPREGDVAAWTSKDGVRWRQSGSEELGGTGLQFAHGVVAFKGKLVIVGNENVSGSGVAAVWVGKPLPATGHRNSPSPSAT